MIKLTKLSLVFVFTSLMSFSISAQMSKIKSTIDPIEAESHLRFLTADELRGRNTGTIELKIAGRYIAEQFRKYGLDPLGDQEGDYTQKVDAGRLTNPPSAATVSDYTISVFDIETDLGFIDGKNGKIEGPIMYMEDPSELETADLKGKIVVTVFGRSSSKLFSNVDTRQEYSKKMGAVGLIEIFGSGSAISSGPAYCRGILNGGEMETLVN